MAGGVGGGGRGALDGVRVLDLSTVGPASRCTALLRDLGAAVVKVLPPERAGRVEPEFHAYGGARHLRRLRLDLRVPGGREAFRRMAGSADVVVESYRPGVADRLGIGYDALRAANGSIVYCAVTGYGQDGPYAGWAGHDLNYLAVGGFLATQGRRAGGGPALPGATVADAAGGGMQAALAVTAALVRRAATGEGCYLDVSTTEGVLWLMSLFVDEHLATGVEAAPGTNLLTGRYACYDVYPCRDGREVAVGAIEGPFFARLCDALGCPQWAAHQFDDDRQEEIRQALREAFARRDRDDWVAELGPGDGCVAPVLSIAEVAGNEHLRARGAFTRAVHPAQGSFEQVGPVVAGAGRPRDPVRLPDAAASDADEVLGEAGFDGGEIAALRAAGVLA